MSFFIKIKKENRRTHACVYLEFLAQQWDITITLEVISIAIDMVNSD